MFPRPPHCPPFHSGTGRSLAEQFLVSVALTNPISMFRRAGRGSAERRVPLHLCLGGCVWSLAEFCAAIRFGRGADGDVAASHKQQWAIADVHACNEVRCNTPCATRCILPRGSVQQTSSPQRGSLETVSLGSMIKIRETDARRMQDVASGCRAIGSFRTGAGNLRNHKAAKEHRLFVRRSC